MPLDLPPGRANFAPDITLTYNGGYGNGPLGIGWRLTLPAIQRQTEKGLPIYDDRHDTFINQLGEELIEVSPSTYRCEHESRFERYERASESAPAWIIRHRDGTASYLGLDRASRIQSGERIFRWHLSKDVDRNGNAIDYAYNEGDAFGSESVPGDGQSYLTSIRYNRSKSSDAEIAILLRYEMRPVDDQLDDYRARFPIRTTQRLIQIIVQENGQRVRSYHLAYHPDASPSQLTRIETYGRDLALGPLESVLSFEYTQFQLNHKLTSMDAGVQPAVGLDLADVDLVDMDGDALPDLIHSGDDHRVFRNCDGLGWGDHAYRVPGGFSEFRLSHPNAMLMDMDGDGSADLFLQDQGLNRFRYFRGGQPDGGWALTETRMRNNPSFTFGQYVKPVDLDNDGRTDILLQQPASRRLNLVFNQAGQSFSDVQAITAPSAGSTFDFAAGLRLADMNGDGLQDFVVLNGEGQVWYYAGRGVTPVGETPPELQGWDRTPRNWPAHLAGAEGYWMADAPNRLDDPNLAHTQSFRDLDLVDANGDGLSDLLYVANNRVLVWLNRGGHGFTPDPYVLSADLGQRMPSMTVGTRVRMADMNGSGTVDVVWNRTTGFTELGYADSSWVYLDLTGGVRPNLLRRIDNGLGKVTSIDYKSSVSDRIEDRKRDRVWSHRLPIPINVVAAVQVCDGLNTVCSRTNFKYRDGDYQGEDREFLGFAEAERHELGDPAPLTPSIGELTTTYGYHTGREKEALKGKTRSILTRNADSQVFYREDLKWNTRPLASGKIDFAYLESKQRDLIESPTSSPANSIRLQWRYDYDDYGNQTRIEEQGRLDDGWNDERITLKRYSADPNSTDPPFAANREAWILDRLIEQTVTDGNGVRVAHSRVFYDHQHVLGEIGPGNPTRVERWVADGQDPIQAERKDYDEYGNVIALYDPLYDPDHRQAGHYRTFSYDSRYHTYPIIEQIHVGGSQPLTARASYDLGLGQITSLIGFNQDETTLGYDNFGRLKAIVKPGDTPSSPTVTYDYVLAHKMDDGRVINWIETRKREVANGGTLDSRTFFDGLSRPIMTRAEGEDPCPEGNSPCQVVVSETVQFNTRKLPWRSYLPYFEQGTLDYAEPTLAHAYTLYEYDALGREIRSTQSDCSFALTEYGPLTKTVRDEEQTDPQSPHHGAATRYVQDGLLNDDGQGRLREIHEIVKLTDLGEPTENPVEWLTRYRYDPLDNFIGYTDAQNNQAFIEYDGLSRKTFVDDPDRGRRRYRYDAASNLIQAIDAKAQEIRYTYDGVNRLLAEYYDRDSPSAPPDVQYHYDVASNQPLTQDGAWLRKEPNVLESSNAIKRGKTSANEIDQDGHGGRINAAKASKSTQRLAAQPLIAKNLLGHLAWIEDQSGEEHRSYDERGHIAWTLKRITDQDGVLQDFLTAENFDSLDRVTSRTYPDGSVTAYAYNRRGLLESIPGVIDRYNYNPAGQNALLALANGVTTTYDYDDRQRLQRLHSVRLRDGLNLQDLHYRYDNVSNILAISDARTPVELEVIGDELGANPETARRFNATQAFEYDDLYRLTQAANDDVFGTITYRYDRIGNLVLKDASALIQPDPAMDLGQIANGGEAGTWNRAGRPAQQTNPAGPHALTSTQRGQDGSLFLDYDRNGNVIREGELTLNWDTKDRLAESNNATCHTRYTYDYSGMRKLKSAINQQTEQHSDVTYIDPFSEIRNLGYLRYVYSGRNRVYSATQSMSDSSDIVDTYFLHDHLGSISYSLDVHSRILEHFAYYPYGNARFVSGENPTRAAKYVFTGKERDIESGVSYFNARYLSETGHIFLSTDPLLASSYLNARDLRLYKPYAYVGGNPLRYIDPYGLDGMSVTGSLLPLSGMCAASDGPFPIGDIVGGVILIGALVYDVYDNVSLNKSVRQNQKILSHNAVPSLLLSERPNGLPPEGILPPSEGPFQEGEPSKKVTIQDHLPRHDLGL